MLSTWGPPDRFKTRWQASFDSLLDHFPFATLIHAFEMEPIVYEDSPLADYLRDGADGSEDDWAPVANSSDRPASTSPNSSPPPSPSPFAPTGRPFVKARFRKDAHDIPQLILPHAPSMRSIRKHYSVSPARDFGCTRWTRKGGKTNAWCSVQAVFAARIDRADNSKFLEKFRYTIVASQLLSGHSILGQHQPAPSLADAASSPGLNSIYSTEGVLASILAALALAIILSWVLGSGQSSITRKRLVFLIVIGAAGLLLGQVYIRRQWLRYRRDQSLSEISAFVSNSHEFDSATTAALSLIQEVELVSRGYRISAPLPPVSRLEDRTQSRKCVRLRKALKASFVDILEEYIQVSNVVKAFSEQTDLEKYLDIYEISDFDISDANRGFDLEEFDDTESLRTLKIVASRFHTVRKIFLCALLALDASGESQDLQRWSNAVETLRSVNSLTEKVHKRLREILSEEESFPSPTTQKMPLTPGRERWRSQLHKLNSLGTGIRGLQAKLQLLREESDRALNDSSDISELGPNLMTQYETIGADLKELMSVWEEGKAALAQGIDRNEKRLSSISTLASPTLSLSGLTTVGEEGNAAAALKALTGESPPASDTHETLEMEPELFEAVARPRPRSMLTREERIAKMKDEREHKARAKQQIDATRGMLRELETVINLRPSSSKRSSMGGRVVSM
ncbi:unnamed protein product [Clonostachys solani]|uniref:Vezatin n=1 Tax=Clonostachys solani TaxID=160281 RepID=A0A9N9Z6P2_9HYPO|nr:unnamed protein product [Clonostachys solani]